MGHLKTKTRYVPQTKANIKEQLTTAYMTYQITQLFNVVDKRFNLTLLLTAPVCFIATQLTPSLFHCPLQRLRNRTDIFRYFL